jgi:hypothetical protein
MPIDAYRRFCILNKSRYIFDLPFDGVRLSIATLPSAAAVEVINSKVFG